MPQAGAGSEDSSGRTEALHARMVGEVREAGLSAADVARVIGVSERQVRNWSAGEHAPRGRNRDRLLELHHLTRLLCDVYTREGSEIWLHGRKRSLAGRRPIDLLAEGSYEEVLGAAERLGVGSM